MASDKPKYKFIEIYLRGFKTAWNVTKPWSGGTDM